jgi:hypothetical protein
MGKGNELDLVLPLSGLRNSYGIDSTNSDQKSPQNVRLPDGRWTYFSAVSDSESGIGIGTLIPDLTILIREGTGDRSLSTIAHHHQGLGTMVNAKHRRTMTFCHFNP